MVLSSLKKNTESAEKEWISECVCVTESLCCNLKLAQYCKSTLPEYKIKIKEEKMQTPRTQNLTNKT